MNSCRPRWWWHLLAVAGGLCIGFAIRGAMRSSQPASPPPAVTVDLPKQSSEPASSSPMKRIYELLDKRRTSARTFGEDAELQAAVVDLDQKRIRKLFESILREGSPFDDLILYTLFSTWGEIAPRDALLAIESLPTNHRKLGTKRHSASMGSIRYRRSFRLRKSW